MVGLTRRDFLKLGGAAFKAAIGATVGLAALDQAQNIPTSIDKDILKSWTEGKISLTGLDVVNKPGRWVGQEGEEFQKKLSETLYNEFNSIFPELRKTFQDNNNYGMGDWEPIKMQSSFNKLLTDLANRGRDLVYAKDQKLNVVEDLNERYYELASYVQMLIGELGYKEQVGLDQFCTEIYNSVTDETIGQIGDSVLEKYIDRRNIDTIWNYDWLAFSKGLRVRSPVGMGYVSPDGSELTYKPYLYKGDPNISPDGLKPPIRYNNESDSTGRPNIVEILNFDSEVATQINKELEKVGLERAINQLTIIHKDHLMGETSTGTDTSIASLGYPEPQTFTLEKYLAREREVLKICMHEGFHSFSTRRHHLSTIEKMKLRSIENDVLESADPLADMQQIFNPGGDDHGFVEDNQYSITRYYLENVCNVYGNMESSARDFLYEFRAVIAMMTNEDIFKTIWLTEKDINMDGLFYRLQTDKDKYTGITKYIAQTLLDNRDNILKRKRSIYPAENDLDYYANTVLPLVFAHLSLYKSNELIESALPENLEKDKGLVRNYIQTYHKRYRSFVKSAPSEEFLAEIFSEAMLTKKYGKHEVNYVNDAVSKFEEMLELMRKNKLATENPNSTV